MSISTTRVLPTSDTKNSYKAKLREYKPYFSSPILAGRMEEIEPMLVTQSSVTGINSHSPISVRLFDYGETVGIGTTSGDLSNVENKLIYFPGLEGDRVIVRVGVETATIDFIYSNAVTVNGDDLTLDNSFTLGGQEFYVRGAGGALIQNGGVAPTYTVTPSATSVDEGSTINFVVNTENVGVGTTLYYGTLVGAAGSTAASNDFTDSLTGSFNIVSDGTATGGIATITRSIASDLNIEGPETFRLVIRTDSITGSAVTLTDDITINDLAPSATVGVSTTSVNEGQSVEFTVNTTNVSAGSTLFFSSGGTAVAADFTDNSLTGSFIVSATGITTFTRTLVAEATGTEGSENFNLVIRTNSTTGTALTTTPSITINDVVPTYNVTPSTTNVAEGDTVTFTINTTDVGDGTTLYWRLVQYGSSDPVSTQYGFTTVVNFSDFEPSQSSGNFNISNNVGIVTLTPELDWKTENEGFSISIRTGSTSGSITTTSSVVTVTDTFASNISITPSSTTVNEDGSITFTITGTNIPTEPYYYAVIREISGLVNRDDFSNLSESSGYFYTRFHIPNGTSQTFTIDLKDDFLTEGVETFVVDVRAAGVTGTLVGTSPVITINDTSRSPGSAANGLTFGPVIVNRDNGNAADATDWYKICNIDDLPEGSSIALFIDNSGSMRTSTVQASYDAFIAKLNEKNITVTTVTNNSEDWITPFLVNLP
jgi:hypothetical protein